MKSKTNKNLALQLYFILGGLFIASLVVSNLIFQKFFTWNAWGIKEFNLSVGILPYPITFLITDLISEVYGKKKANLVVTAGVFASLFSLGIVYTANATTAMPDSPVSDALFTTVFGQTAIAVLASMLAYLFAQYIDIYVFHFWKKITKGKMLWLRNNFSTFTSQFIDTFSVLFLLCYYEIIDWSLFSTLFWSGFLFKICIAALDTPFLYIGIWIFRKIFKLAPGEEIQLE